MRILHVSPRPESYLLAISKSRAIWRLKDNGNEPCTFALCDKDGIILTWYTGFYFEMQQQNEFKKILEAKI